MSARLADCLGTAKQSSSLAFWPQNRRRQTERSRSAGGAMDLARIASAANRFAAEWPTVDHGSISTLGKSRP